MSRENVFQLRIDPEVRQDVEAQASEAGITSSEWIREAIDVYLAMDGNDTPSVEELDDMDWSDLCGVIDDLELDDDIDPTEYDTSGFLGSPSEDDTDNLREALLDLLDLSVEAEEIESD